MSEDMIRDLLNMVKMEKPDFTDAQAKKVEAQIRQQWGGERFTVAKGVRKSKEIREEAVKTAKSKGVDHAADGAGVDRRTLYRWLKKEK